MADKKKTEDDSVTVKGLPGHPEKVGKSMSRRGEDIATEAKEDLEDQGKIAPGTKGSGRPPSDAAGGKGDSQKDDKEPRKA